MLRFEPSEHDPSYIRVWRDDRLMGAIVVATDSDETTVVFFEKNGPFTLAEMRAITDKMSELDREAGK